MRKIILIICLIIFVLPIFSINNPEVVIKTEFGKITVELFLKAAPITVKNFLKHVKNKAYKNSSIYRTVTMDNQPENKIKIEVIQGERNFKFVKTQYGKEFLKNPGIKHETTKQTGILHKNGTISMARDKPGTADFSYFICINDQPSLDFGGKRNPDGQGFAAFGRVIKGMKLIRKIQMSPAKGQNLKPIIIVNNISIIQKKY